MKKIIILAILFFLSYTNLASAHPGRTNSAGCHNDKTTDSRHCHKPQRDNKN